MQRKFPLVTDHIYHIYNRGVDKRDIFLDSAYYARFLDTLSHCLKYSVSFSTLNRQLKQAKTPDAKKAIFEWLEKKRIDPVVEIISFCLMPNHFHLMLKQLAEKGITEYIQRVCTSYSKYFNIRQDRKGSLFECNFYSVFVDNEKQLIHLSRYQHLNPTKLGLGGTQELVSYPWSSLQTYTGQRANPFVNPSVVLDYFRGPKEYLEFVLAENDEFEPVRLEDVAIDDDFGWFSRFRNEKKDYKENLREQYFKMFS